jgi:ribose transport system ATP-binding protein
MSDRQPVHRPSSAAVGNVVLLRLQQISKSFGLPVLERVNFELRSGEIHGLVGANGAGKSTLCRIISGLLQPCSGSMVLAGETYAPTTKQQAEVAGVQFIQQELSLIPTLTIAENLMRTRMPSWAGIIRRGELKRRARLALDRLELSSVATDSFPAELGVGLQQLIEIATALDRECRVLLLDEPTASLSSKETEVLFSLLRKLADQGVGMLYISHRLDEVLSLCDRVTFLRDGQYIKTCSTQSLSINQMVAEMTGVDPAPGQQPKIKPNIRSDSAAQVPLLSVKKYSRAGFVEDVSFDLMPGERLGIAGLVGSGRTELLRLIFGADRADAGELWLRGKRLERRFQEPAEAVKVGLAMVTEDRKQQGLLLAQSIRLNSSLNCLSSKFSSVGVVNRQRELDAVSQCHRSLATHYATLEQPVQTLSGGNQQKVVISRWLLGEASIFFFDEPTRGIDLAARRKIYDLFDALAAEGKGLVIVSSELEELMETCDRMLVMSAGHLVGNFLRSQWIREQIMQAAFSGYASGEQR